MSENNSKMKRRLISIGVLTAFLAGCSPFYSLEQADIERGYRWVRRGEMDKAIATFEKTIEFYPESVLAHVALADVFFETYKDREAVDSYNRAVTLLEKAKPESEDRAPGEPEMIGKRFFSYQNQGIEFPHGLEAYVHLRRGSAFESLAKHDSRLDQEYFSKAMADYDKAIELAPTYEEAKKFRNSLLSRFPK